MVLCFLFVYLSCAVLSFESFSFSNQATLDLIFCILSSVAVLVRAIASGSASQRAQSSEATVRVDKS